MRAVALPGLYRTTIDGLPNLLRAGCSDRPFGLVETDTLFFERQVTERQDPAYLRLQVCNHLLVLNPQYLPGQYRIPSGP